MIDSDPKAEEYAQVGIWGRATLDALFKRNLARSPDRLALCDTGDRRDWSDQPPLRLTYRQADDIITALAARFVELGLRGGSVVALQMPNCVETALLLLACGRAGLVPAMLPLLWRASDVTRALDALAAKAIVTVARAGDDLPADYLRYAAAELFSVRFVLSFGSDIPDGVMSLEECLKGQPVREPRFPAPHDAPADQPALITFATHIIGQTAVMRTHNHCVCSGLVMVLEASLEPGDVIASAVMPSSLAGLATSVFSWLLTGGTLVLHQPFDFDAFEAAIEAEKVRYMVVPGALLDDLAPRLADTPHRLLRGIVGVHSDATRLGTAGPLSCRTDLIDVTPFDELGIAARRRDKGHVAALPVGIVHHPGQASAGPVLIETKLGGDGTVLVRGPQVPFLSKYADGFRLTTLRGKRDAGTLEGLTRQAGLAYIGGLGVAAAEIERILLASDDVDAAKVVPVSDPLFGQRIEAHIAPRVNGGTQGEALIERVKTRFATAGIGAFKSPSRIVIDHRLRGNMMARQRSSTQS